MPVIVDPAAPLVMNAAVSGPATTSEPSVAQMMSMQPSGSTRYSSPVGRDVQTIAPGTRLGRSNITPS